MVTGSIIRLVIHGLFGIFGGVGYYLLSTGKAKCQDFLCELEDGLRYFVGGIALAEILGLPIDIFNLWMMKSENKNKIATSTWALVLNWLFFAGNFVEVGTIAYLYFSVLWEKFNGLTDIVAPGLMLALFNIPGIVLLYTQINAFLYIHEIKKNGVLY